MAEDGPAVLAIEDADDFGADDDDLLTSDDSDDEGSDDGADGEFNPFQPIPVVLLDDGAPAGGDGRLQPLATASLPASAYMLVDKTVELQARPLSEFPELGRLPAAELERQALVVFLNPRQAKRQCGRTQRVIKVPDLKVFELTAPYLLAQGISRVVIEEPSTPCRAAEASALVGGGAAGQQQGRAGAAADHPQHQGHAHDEARRQRGAAGEAEAQLGPLLQVLGPQAEQGQQQAAAQQAAAQEAQAQENHGVAGGGEQSAGSWCSRA